MAPWSQVIILSGMFISWHIEWTLSMHMTDIDNNRFYVDIHRWIGTFVLALKILRLSSNNFSGQIPPELSQLSQLQLLDLAHNGLTGLILRELGDLASMKHPKINSSTGSLDGSIYQDRIDIIWKGQKLRFQRILELMTGIDLSGNSLSHCIPDELTNLQGLQFLNLSRNRLSCGIPSSIGSLNVLESLDLSLNKLSGAIPPGLSNMLFLSLNKLSGLYYCVIAGVIFGFWLCTELCRRCVLPIIFFISKDFDELLKMAAADKREELEVFTKEVIRFGNYCKDPQWHNLDRYFEKLASELAPRSYLKGKAESVMQKLVTCVQNTVVRMA
ncbi:Receptor-like protein 12 [Zea mays]|uniref:Receptor-like protein 12 n=2 Tax=Zea mays TaxID=4577 RepID=A0A3L6EWW3_MAIZE|nr:Receptor-like protein 12 [Zea mays]